jgi:hypothetical protein
MQKLRNIPDYWGISFTLATETASNPLPIVKEQTLRIGLFCTKKQVKPEPLRGSPDIPALNDGGVRLVRIK